MSEGPVLVAGATGAVGRRVVAALVGENIPTRVLVRDPSRLGSLADRVEVMVGDALAAPSLASAFIGARAVFSSVGASLRPSLTAGWRGYQAVDLPANRNLIAAARSAGVPRFVYVSMLVNDATRRCAYVDAHERVVAVLRGSDLDWCVLRPTGFHSGLLAFLDLARRGRVPMFGDPQVRTNPIADDDLAEAAVQQLLAPAPLVERELPLGGPEVMSRQQMVALAFEAMGLRAETRNISPGLGRALASLVRPVSPRMSDFLRFAIAAGEDDLVAPAYGRRFLLDSYKEALADRAGA